MKNNVETDMSGKARTHLEKMVCSGEIPSNSPNGREIKNLKYKENLTNYFKKPSGELDFKKIYLETILPSDQEEIDILKIIVKLDLTEEEAHQIIKERYIYGYSPENFKNRFLAKKIVNKKYPLLCEFCEIKPSLNFLKEF
ncbi:MAG: hypothetical protein KJ949_03435 [Nanoarchaeota archaeon]|nr:hypothetical protein [Nanoarchaeota archaeon]